MTDIRIDIHRLASGRWLRALIIVATLTLSAVIAFRGQGMLTLLVIAIPAFFILYWVLTHYPTVGPLLIVISGMMVPFEISLTFYSSLNAPMLLLGLFMGIWILDMLIVKRQIGFHAERVFIPIIALVIIATLSLLTGQLDWFSVEGAPITAQLAGYGLFILMAATFFYGAHQIKSLRGLEWMVWTFLAFATVYMVGRAIPPLTVTAFNLFPRNAFGSVFWIWVVALSASQAIFNDKMALPFRVVLGSITLLTLYVAVGPGLTWASGWVPAVVVMAVLIGFKSPRLLIPVVLIVAMIVVMNFQTLLNEFWLGLSHEQYSANTRVAAWQIVLQIAGKNPIWGLGPSNYYYYTPLYTLLGYRVQFNSHSQYVDLIAQVGVVGLGIFFWIMAEIGRLGFQISRRARAGFARAYSYGAVAGLIAMFVAGFLGDWLIPFLYNISLGGFRASVIGWLFLSALVAMKHEFPEEALLSEDEILNKDVVPVAETGEIPVYPG
jgi:O-antigen ligase